MVVDDSQLAVKFFWMRRTPRGLDEGRGRGADAHVAVILGPGRADVEAGDDSRPAAVN